MRTAFCALLTIASLVALHPASGAEPIFQDNFQGRLSEKWQVVGLKDTDYRIRDGGLEMRVQPGKLTNDTPMLKLKLPFNSREGAIVSVKVTVLNDFTQDGEFGGVYFLDESGLEFGARKERKGKELIYAPGEVVFNGKDGQEADFSKYETIIVKESADAGPLRIIVNQGYAYFQVGPSTKGKYHNHFYSATASRGAGFALVAAGAAAGEEHWVRFEDFKVTR